jgi:hypothetical protein
MSRDLIGIRIAILAADGMVPAGTIPADWVVGEARADAYDALLLPGGTVNPDHAAGAFGSGLLAGPADQFGVDGGDAGQDRRPGRRSRPGQGQGGVEFAAGAF